eukprot:323045_1
MGQLIGIAVSTLSLCAQRLIERALTIVSCTVLNHIVEHSNGALSGTTGNIVWLEVKEKTGYQDESLVGDKKYEVDIKRKEFDGKYAANAAKQEKKSLCGIKEKSDG